VALVLTCPEGYTGPISMPEDEFYWSCFHPGTFSVIAPKLTELEPATEYAGLLCPGTLTEEVITGGTMVYCSEPWLTQPGAIGGAWGAELSSEDIGALVGAALLVLAAAFAGRAVIQAARSYL
jgi:hypothetical protein